MRDVCNGIKKVPHPEEAPLRAVSKPHPEEPPLGGVSKDARRISSPPPNDGLNRELLA